MNDEPPKLGPGMATPAFAEVVERRANDPEYARELQKKSRAAVAQNRKQRVGEALEHAAEVWATAGRAINANDLANLEEGATTAGIARAADVIVAQSLAAILSGDQQFVPQHGKEAVEMAKAMSTIARDYKARAQLERLEREATGRKVKSEEAAAKAVELVALLKGRLGQA